MHVVNISEDEAIRMDEDAALASDSSKNLVSDIRACEHVLLMVLLGLGFYGTRMNKGEQE